MDSTSDSTASLTATMFQTQEFPSPSDKGLASPPTSFVSPNDLDFDGTPSVTGPATESVASGDNTGESSTSAPKKKRKSWGQVLPLPTTNLPPRKRAKTDAEKEQRKYERVQRNRAAAHASRMRKQEEMDKLRAENNQLIQDNEDLQQQLERLKSLVASVHTASKTSPSARARLPTPPPTENPSSRVPSLTSGSPHSSPSSASINTPPPDNETPLFAPQSTVDIGFAFYGQETEGAAKNAQAPMMDMPNFMMNMTPTSDNQPFGNPSSLDFDLSSLPPAHSSDFAMGDFLNMDGADFGAGLGPLDTLAVPATAFEPKSECTTDSTLMSSLLNMDQFESGNP